ncbi:hypothetical protein A3D68_00840 [Candidatus Adlerbacteria bacterium RIFCSPHIGHO2_02_FULL_52_17]|uniref:Uncharacterized protein n=1 Tax=Candidatus Adlerbacteria bacterium RIFCSPHIGHO2_02_FULL_52_17 TaxID=1797240 RepID=A0A1F4XML3_9BACT|nr:MAG: hypothetical protein A3D68_00840 [Candidatus Adlerbacteria bacterium RIFCSPHIGHO2_02_FULL_52_17]
MLLSTDKRATFFETTTAMRSVDSPARNLARYGPQRIERPSASTICTSFARKRLRFESMVPQ